MKTLIFPIITYGSESWTLNSSCQRRIEAFEMIAYRRMLRIQWTDHRTNVSVIQELNIHPKTAS
ncbi:casein kinase I [Aphis craccivora]|uniref:Casein kinase I n=1 Tax=Aphis craccivora TaxID=307492 RepID=A0A6G0XZG2_APHCR|nr:casein kinase I [Aphis craccivora]